MSFSLKRNSMTQELKTNGLEIDSELLRHRPRLSSITRYPPPRTTLAALLLLVGGIVMLISGLVVFFQDREGSDRGLPIFILGAISTFQFIFLKLIHDFLPPCIRSDYSWKLRFLCSLWCMARLEWFSL
jgi:hypothetical protein